MSPEDDQSAQHVAHQESATIAGLMDANVRLVRLLEESWRLEEQRQAERREWISERASLRAMIDEVPDYLFVKDTLCRFTIANRAVAADLGARPIGILGKTDLELHPAERAREFMADDERVIRTGEPMIDKEEFVVLPSGKQRWLSTSKVPLRGEDGSIHGLVGIARDITLRKEAEQQVRFLAYHDPLTKLPNRASCEATIGAWVEQLPPGNECRLLLIDLDGFKEVNDTLGHAAGDELLRMVASRLAELARSHNEVARLGGDEFVILRPYVSETEEAEFCDQLIHSLASPFVVMGHSLKVGGSVGVSKLHPLATPLSAMREADIALYRAKSCGRGRWMRFESKMAVDLERRQRLEDELRLAVDNDPSQIRVHYQAIYDVTGRTLRGLEALVRWQHPEMGLLPPDVFIPLAEERGIIFAIGDIVLNDAARVLRETSTPWIAVNVSPLQLKDGHFAERFLATLEGAEVSPKRLQIEITENLLVEALSDAGVLLDRLRSKGVRVALDDFGVGYSSLGYLAKLQVDKIKIDRAFVAQIGTSSGNAVVRAMLAFAKALEMAVTAEGVETEEQRDFLARAGCDEIQGYLFSRPAPPCYRSNEEALDIPQLT